MKKFRNYLKRVYKLTFKLKKQEDFVWSLLKKLHDDAQWNSGVYEKEKSIETVFSIEEDRGNLYNYLIFDGFFYCRTKIIEDYPVELTSEIFILATHFNNLFTYGVVKINVERRCVEYVYKRDVLVPLLYEAEIYNQLIIHFNSSKDVYASFKRLLVEQESPAIIIADLLAQKEKEEGGN